MHDHLLPMQKLRKKEGKICLSFQTFVWFLKYICTGNFSESWKSWLMVAWHWQWETQLLYWTQMSKGASKPTQNELLVCILEDCMLLSLIRCLIQCLIQDYSKHSLDGSLQQLTLVGGYVINACLPHQNLWPQAAADIGRHFYPGQSQKYLSAWTSIFCYYLMQV